MSGTLISQPTIQTRNVQRNVFVTKGEPVEKAFRHAWCEFSLDDHPRHHWQAKVIGRFGMGKSNALNYLVAATLNEARDRSKWTWLRNLPKDATSHFLVFVDSDVQPQSIAEAMSSLQVRSADRILFQPTKSKALLQQEIMRWLSAFATDGQDHIFTARWDNDQLNVRAANLEVLRVPLDKLQAVRKASAAVWADFSIDDHGAFIYWPKLDVHMGWSQLQQLVDPTARVRAEQKSEAFNRRYGAAIRTLREEKDLKQTQIDGLTDKTVRRIESGETRATSQAIAKLAKAHQLSPTAYMNEVASRLKPKAKSSR